jgi:hypothetical protein
LKYSTKNNSDGFLLINLLKYNSTEYVMGDNTEIIFVNMFYDCLETIWPYPAVENIIIPNPDIKAVISLSKIAPQACPNVIAFRL